MYKCCKCESRFDEPDRKEISYEDYYGVSDLFQNSHRMDLLVCPFCQDDDIEELSKCDLCDEWFEEEALIDTDGMVNGSVGYVCEQCLHDNDIE